jgi:hypothetical protein
MTFTKVSQSNLLKIATQVKNSACKKGTTSENIPGKLAKKVFSVNNWLDQKSSKHILSN